MNIMCVGDVHLGKNLNLGKVSLDNNSRLEDQFKLLDWVLHQANENKVKDIFFTGDLFEDPSPEIFILKLFAFWLKKATSQGFILHFVEGNHDFVRMHENYLSSLDIFKALELDQIHFYRDVSNVMINGYNIILAPFRDRKSLFCESQEEAVEKIQKIILTKKAKNKNICIGHLAIKDSIPIGDEVDDLTNEIFIPSEFFKEFDYTWLGHIHKFQIFHKEPNYVSHLGSLDISNFGEKDQEKFIVVFDTVKHSFKYISVPVRKYRTIEIDIPEDVTDSTSYVLNSIKDVDVTNEIVKIEIKHLSSSNASSRKKEIEQALKQKDVFFVNAIIEAKKIELVKKKTDVVIKDKTNVSEALTVYAKKAELVPISLQEKFLELSKQIVREGKT